MTENLDTGRAAKLVRMLSSPNHGEVANAAALLCKLGIHRIAELIEDNDASKGHTLKRRVEHLSRENEQLSRENDSLQAMVDDQLKCCAVCGEGLSPAAPTHVHALPDAERRCTGNMRAKQLDAWQVKVDLSIITNAAEPLRRESEYESMCARNHAHSGS